MRNILICYLCCVILSNITLYECVWQVVLYFI